MPIRNGFLVSPVKAPGPQPITVHNLSGHAVTYTLTPVATVMVGRYCAPTTKAVKWFHVAQRTTVAAHKTVTLPVSLSSHPAVPTDVAVKISPAKDHGRVSIEYAAYAQEIIGGIHGSGCAHVRGITTAAPSDPPAHGFPPMDIAGIGLFAAVLVTLVARMVRRPKNGGTHAR